MAREYYTVATFRSSSRGNLWHRVSKDDAGNLSCTCPGWCRRVASDGSRTCKHVRKVLDRGSQEVSAPRARKIGPRPSAKPTILGKRRFRL